LSGLLFCSTLSCVNNDVTKITELKKLEYNPKDLYKIKISSFKLKSKVPGNENVTCYYARPYKKDGSLAPRAGTVIYYAHYPMEKNYYKIPKKNSRRRIFIDLARRSGFTVFSVDFANSPIMAHYKNPKSYYYYPSSGSADTIVEAYDIMLKKTKMPFSKFFMTGLSGGPSMSVNFTNTHPDKVDALALQAGNKYTVPLKKSSAAWLIVYTLQSSTQKKNEALAAGLRRMGKFPIVVRTMPNWELRGKRLFTHCENWHSTNLRNIFLEDVADLRSKNNNIMPPENEWPYVISMSNKNKILENSGQKLLFKDPLYMPSLRFYNEYMKVIPNPLQIKLKANNKMLVGIPAPACKPKGIIIKLSNVRNNRTRYLDYDARFFSENGYIYLTTSGASNIEIFKQTLVEKFASQLKDTPIFIVADKLQAKNFDFNIENLAKVIIFCENNDYLTKIKTKLNKLLKMNVKITLLVHDKKLIEVIKQDFKDSVKARYVKSTTVKPKKMPSRIIVFCKDKNDITKIKAPVKEILKTKIKVYLLVHDKKLLDVIKQEFKSPVNAIFTKPNKNPFNVIYLCNNEKNIRAIKGPINEMIKAKLKVNLLVQDKKLLGVIKQEFNDSVKARYIKPSKRQQGEVISRNNNKAILNALNNIPLKSIEKQNKQTTLSP
jgi:hypothetical protein